MNADKIKLIQRIQKQNKERIGKINQMLQVKNEWIQKLLGEKNEIEKEI